MVECNSPVEANRTMLDCSRVKYSQVEQSRAMIESSKLK